MTENGQGFALLTLGRVLEIREMGRRAAEPWDRPARVCSREAQREEGFLLRLSRRFAEKARAVSPQVPPPAPPLAPPLAPPVTFPVGTEPRAATRAAGPVAGSASEPASSLDRAAACWCET